MERAIHAVERVMEAHGRSRVISPDLLHADAPRGEFHIKTGGVLHGADGGVFGLKANGGFFGNHALGLSNIVGIIYLADARAGSGPARPPLSPPGGSRGQTARWPLSWGRGHRHAPRSRR